MQHLGVQQHHGDLVTDVDPPKLTYPSQDASQLHVNLATYDSISGETPHWGSYHMGTGCWLSWTMNTSHLYYS